MCILSYKYSKCSLGKLWMTLLRLRFKVAAILLLIAIIVLRLLTHGSSVWPGGSVVMWALVMTGERQTGREKEREGEQKWRSGLDVMWCFLTVWYLGLKAWWHYCINHGRERKNRKAQHGHPILSTSVNRFTQSPVSVSVFVPVYMLNNKHVCARRWRSMVHITLNALCNVCHHTGSQLALDNFHYGGWGGLGGGWGQRCTHDNGDKRCRLKYFSTWC